MADGYTYWDGLDRVGWAKTILIAVCGVGGGTLSSG